MIDGEPWLVAVDVCKALKLNPSKVAQRLEKSTLSKFESASEELERLLIISEKMDINS